MSDARERILESAVKIFADNGFNGASTRAIAGAAGVHQPAIAYHFKNKDELWKCAVSSVWNDFMAALNEKMATMPEDADRTYEFVKFYLRYNAEVPETIIFVIQESARSDERSQWFIHNLLSPQAGKLYHAMTGREWPERGSEESLRAISMLSLLTGSTRIFFQRAAAAEASGVDPRSKAFIRIHAETVTTAVKALLQG
ncbi:MAG: TetR/AcrR family transcriptional regulator [Porticoccaceae bacterium]